MKLSRKQSGFTLIEIAIVLVIIGLLLGGVLKGQELINSAKVKNFATDFKSVPLFIYGYQDKFKALPGDDAKYTTNIGAAATAAGVTAIVVTGAGTTLGNGRLEGSYNSVTLTDETIAFWQHVRLANLAAGPTAFAAISDTPTNADGGRIGVQSTVPITGMTGSYFVCSEGIQGKFAKQLDTTMDDGNTAAGSMRTAVAVQPWTAALTAVATASIVDGTTYVVCMGF